MGLSLIIFIFQKASSGCSVEETAEGKRKAGGNQCQDRSQALQAGGVGSAFQLWDPGEMR